jgi:hypothetical protein
MNIKQICVHVQVGNQKFCKKVYVSTPQNDSSVVLATQILLWATPDTRLRVGGLTFRHHKTKINMDSGCVCIQYRLRTRISDIPTDAVKLAEAFVEHGFNIVETK